MLTKSQTELPKLTAAETRLFLLIKLGSETSEIAENLSIVHDSVWRSRHRLAEKLDLPDTNTLDSFISSF